MLRQKSETNRNGQGEEHEYLFQEGHVSGVLCSEEGKMVHTSHDEQSQKTEKEETTAGETEETR